MRYELSNYEWTAIKPMLPNKPRGVPRVNDRRVLNGIFWVLRSGAPWRDLPENYGPYTTCYNRFVRWRQAGIWDQIMEALAAGHDAAVQMIDTSVVRVHQHGACIADNNHQDMGRSRGGLTSKIHAVVDTNGLPVHLALTPVRHTTIGFVRFFLARCCHKRCYSRIVDTTRTGSGSLPASKEHGRTFRRNEIAKTLSASARICIAHAT
jgi:transposase